MEILIAAVVLIFLIKFGLAIAVFCITHWIAAILIFAAIVMFFA